MLKFKPISYGEDDFVGYKFSSGAGSAVIEGHFCYVASSDLNTQNATPYSGVFANATVMFATLQIGSKYFPIYKEDPDIENVGATISAGDFVVGFFGKEFEIHESATESGYASQWTAIGQKACVGSTGKLARYGGTNSTAIVIGECVGTFGAEWIRIKKF